MSAEIINLKQVRKQRARDEKEARAAENRARFGRSKSERALGDDAHTRATRALDGHRLQPSTDVDVPQPHEIDPKPTR